MKDKKLTINTLTPKDAILVDFQKILSRIISYWWLFALCMLIAIGAGQFYLRYTVFEYSSRAILLIKDAGRSGNLSEQSILMAESGLSGEVNQWIMKFRFLSLCRSWKKWLNNLI